MNKKLLLGALLIGSASIFTACSDDNDSNPTLIQPTEFVLNTPAYVNETVDLSTSHTLRLTWSQPQYTAENAPINATYEVQVSPSNSFTVSTTEADADESGATVADYAIIDKTSTTCSTDLIATDLNKALMKVAKWATDAAVPDEQVAYLRVNAYVLEGSKKLNPIVSNVVEVKVKPFYVELKDADPIMWYMVGNNIADGSWGSDPAKTCCPMFLQSGYTYDKTTGGGEITYLNYFTTDSWKIQPSDFNWDYGFMGDGTNANTAVYRNGKPDAGNIWCASAGYYLVTVNTINNTCTIVQQNITPTVFDQICISGDFNSWGDEKMIPANKTGENHVWYYVMTVDAGSTVQFKFKVPGNPWTTSWGYGSADGEVNTCGKCTTSSGHNIGLGEGTWVIGFNDITSEFSIIAKKSK